MAKAVKAMAKSVVAAAADASAARQARRAANPAPRQRRRVCCSAAHRKWLVWSAWPMLCLAWLLGLPVRDTFAALARTSGSVADVVAAASDLAGVGANATIKFAEATKRVLSSTIALSEEVWHGVDLRDLHLHRSAIRAQGTC